AEVLARVLEHEPVDRQQLEAGDRAPVATGDQFNEELALVGVAEDLDDVPLRVAQVEVDRGTFKALAAQAAEEAVALERELEALTRVIAEQPRLAGRPG